ncbi:MAG: class II fructose-bisphosphatase [Acidobacteriota bacterium]
MKLESMGLELARATEAAALSAGRWMGFGKKDEPDGDAIEAMHRALNQVEMDGHIVVGEEEKLHRHSLLDTGQQVGTGQGPELDIVVDPIDGRELLARGYPDAISVAGAAPRGSMWSPPREAVYMDKIVVNREASEVLVPECMDAPAAWTLALVARAKNKEVRDLVVFVLDRPRHADLIEEVRAVGARVLLRPEGDIAGALMAASPKGKVDLLMGAGGIPEGVIATCAVKALGGAMLGRLAPQSDQEKKAVKEAGLDTSIILDCDHLISSDEIFFSATGITDGVFLSGVRYHGNIADTESLILNTRTDTRRLIQAEHILPED